MKLQGDAKFLFFTMMQAALRMKQMNKNQEDFLEFAKGIWESMEMNKPSELQRILQEHMMSDLEKFVKENEKKAKK